VNPTFIENSDELRGYQSSPWHDGAGSMAATLTAKARVRPDMLGLLCYMVTGGTPTATTGTVLGHSGNATGTGAYETKYAWSAADIPRTATIQFAPTKGDGFKLSGCGLTTLAFSFEQSGALIADMTFNGLYFKKTTMPADQIDLLLAPYETDVPLKKSNFTFTGDGVFSASDSKATDVNWTIENQIANFFSFGANSIWPDAVEYDGLWSVVSGSVTKRQVKATDYEKWVGKGADTHFAECIGGVGDFLSGTAGPKFEFYVHLPAAQFMNMNPEAITNKRRIGVTFDWEARTDSNGTGNWCDIYVKNANNPTVYTTPSA
jgi:hypothetical protein